MTDDSKSRSKEHGRDARVTITWIAPATFALLTLLMFIDVLFSSQRVVSAAGGDTDTQFIAWRTFGFTLLADGNLPLWNPHIFGGTPYFAGFQSALLYPPNWVHLILPVGVAINWLVALHVFLAGYFTYLWCRLGRNIGIGGSLLAGVMFMFCGPYFLHVHAGHLPHLAVMVWTPLMLLAIDRLADTGDVRWCLLGVAATSMHILAGHPQYVYYTGIALVLYTCIRAIRSRRRIKLLHGVAGIYIVAILITAIQLFSGIQAASEFVRAGGTRYEFASTFSLPPQNLLTALVPGFFGNIRQDHATYWGAGYLWEMSLFASITGLVLAAIGAVRGQRRTVILMLAMAVITLILALGRHTPLYTPLFKWLPAYSSFRGTVKFAYLTTLFVVPLAGMGFESVLHRRRVHWGVVAALVGIAGLLAVLGIVIRSADETWAQFASMVRINASKAEELFTNEMTIDATFLADSARHAATRTLIAACTFAIIALIVWAKRFHKLLPYALLLLAALEMFLFARPTRATLKLADALSVPEPWRQSLEQRDRDTRVLTIPHRYANAGMADGFDNLIGYDPGILRRYAELMVASQGLSPSEASQYLQFRGVNQSVFRMMRCGLVFYDIARPPQAVPEPLPVALIVSDWVKFASREAMFAYITGGTFDPSTTVVLEEPPTFQTTSAAARPGTVRVTSQSTDALNIEADLDRAGILVITNNYSHGWRVIPITAGQERYEIVPANYVHMGIPLQKGRHHLRIEYSPREYRIGRWVSILALLGFIGASIWLMRGRLWFR